MSAFTPPAGPLAAPVVVFAGATGRPKGLAVEPADPTPGRVAGPAARRAGARERATLAAAARVLRPVAGT